jgi:hypothetical protein
MSTDTGQIVVPTEDAAALERLGAALRRLAEGSSLEEALQGIAEAAAAATAADVAVLRLVGESGALEAHAVAASSQSVAAELRGSRVTADGVGSLGRRLGLEISLVIPIVAGEQELGQLELFRRVGRFGPPERAVSRLAAEHAAVALTGVGANGERGRQLGPGEVLRLGGDALAAGLDERRTAEEIARLAAQATAAQGALVWRLDDDLQPRVAATFGGAEPNEAAIADALVGRKPFAVAAGSWVLQLGHPPVGALQLSFDEPPVPSDDLLDALMTFAARATHALLSSERARRQAVELERSRCSRPSSASAARS